MNAGGSFMAAGGVHALWPVAQGFEVRRSASIAVALLVHAGIAWLVLSGTGATIVKDVVRKPPQITVIPYWEPPPPPVRPPEPATRQPATTARQSAPVEVPTPEVPSTVSTDAPVLATQPGPAGDTESPAGGPGTAPVVQGPRGFGSITNRTECSAAFAQSFPREARRNGQQGAVTLQVRVSPSGVVQAAEVLGARPQRVFDRAALGVMLSGACKFESDAAGYVAVLEVSYRLSGDSAD